MECNIQLIWKVNYASQIFRKKLVFHQKFDSWEATLRHTHFEISKSIIRKPSWHRLPKNHYQLLSFNISQAHLDKSLTSPQLFDNNENDIISKTGFGLLDQSIYWWQFTCSNKTPPISKISRVYLKYNCGCNVKSDYGFNTVAIFYVQYSLLWVK